MNKLLIGDGGMGTELRMRGVNVPSHEDSIWSALALIENIPIIKEIHLDFIEAAKFRDQMRDLQKIENQFK